MAVCHTLYLLLLISECLILIASINPKSTLSVYKDDEDFQASPLVLNRDEAGLFDEVTNDHLRSKREVRAALPAISNITKKVGFKIFNCLRII